LIAKFGHQIYYHVEVALLRSETSLHIICSCHGGSEIFHDFKLLLS